MTEKLEIQVFFKAQEWFSGTFQGKFHFEGLFKPVQTLIINNPSFYSFQAVFHH